MTTESGKSNPQPADAPPTAESDERLAVVIPAFKGRHLAETLESFAAQTDRRFRVYVADDASPDDLASIVAGYANRLNLVYRRFPENLGGGSLARHWQRAIDLGDEAWVWLFSDDDLASPGCVAAFWMERAQIGTMPWLFRFPTAFIDGAGMHLGDRGITPYPALQSWDEHLRASFAPDRRHLVIMQNIIFRRDVAARAGGLTDYPLGFWADFVIWAKFAQAGGIRTIGAARVFYRLHADSIGGGMRAGARRVLMIRTAGRMLRDLRMLAAAEGVLLPLKDQLIWFGRQFRYLEVPPTADERVEIRRVLADCWPAWPVLREAVFWWHAGRPYVRRYRWVRKLAGG